jgi:tripartite-type tricarboxylate transporter receptor subunit TctC
MPRLQESSETLAGVTAPLTRGLRAWSTAGSLSLAAIAIAAAQTGASDYPNRPVRIIVNVAPGGGVDTATRIVAQRLAERMGQPFVVENRASASGNVGAEAVFHAVPDGYTLLSSSGSPLAINGWIYRKLNYDPAGFEPVAIMSRIPNVLVVRNDFPAATVKDFIDYVKAHSGKVSYASQGSGTASHLTAELFMALTKTSLVHVPYKGTSPSSTTWLRAMSIRASSCSPPRSNWPGAASCAFWRSPPTSASTRCPTFRRWLRAAIRN